LKRAKGTALLIRFDYIFEVEGDLSKGEMGNIVKVKAHTPADLRVFSYRF